MDFFERQDNARRHTGVLIFYFGIAVALLVIATYAAVLVAFGHGGFSDSDGQTTFNPWAPDLFFFSAIGTLARKVSAWVREMASAPAGSLVSSTKTLNVGKNRSYW